MPDCSCHPIAAHKKLRLPDWFVSSLMLDRALDAILRRITLDRSHDIPYLAGYSVSGTTIYIDRHLPRFFTYRGRRVAVDRYLVLHEAVEKTLEDELHLHYQHAHQIATRAEEAAVRADGIGWRDYDRFMQRYVKAIGDERLTRVPADLDEKPYRDEHDDDLLRRMRGVEATIARRPGARAAPRRTATAPKRMPAPPARRATSRRTPAPQRPRAPRTTKR